MRITKLLLIATTILPTISCVGPTAKQQAYHFKDAEEFLARPDIHPKHTNHWMFDRDLLNRLADRDALLNRQ